ncbi:MAG: hypothetical protein CM15mP127_08640 [Gammaproteobacteria bacterium]|nr:MAG: hypothetical protein CM15mP127_08640 [Gammaproteobacteria bacterium]
MVDPPSAPIFIAYAAIISVVVSSVENAQFLFPEL